METLKKILKKANVVPLLRLARKKEGGGVEGTGPHRVKLLKTEIGKRPDQRWSNKKEP